MRTRSHLAGALLVGATVLAGCGGQSDVADVHHPADVVATLRSTTSFDYQPFTSPLALMKSSQIAVVGTVTAVDAATVRVGSGPATGAAIVSLNVTKTWKSDAGSNGTVYLLLQRPTEQSVDLYRQALSGTRVALLGYRTTQSIASGAPPAQVYEAAPQGLFVELTPGGSTQNVWGDEWPEIKTMADLDQALS